MAIYRLLEGAAYDPAKVRIMIEAYECACRELNLHGNQTDQLTEIIAKKIVELTQLELDADPKVICEKSLEQLGITKH